MEKSKSEKIINDALRDSGLQKKKLLQTISQKAGAEKDGLEYQSLLNQATNNLEIVKGYNRLFSKFNYIFNFGTLYILTGSNGIGKTTLLRCICGFLRPESGSLLWNNIIINNEYKEYEKNIFYLGHLDSLSSNLSVSFSR